MSPRKRKSPGWIRLGAFVQQIREAAGDSQTQTAEKLNAVSDRVPPYAQPRVSMYEEGKEWTPEVVNDYVLAYHLNPYRITDLLGGYDLDPDSRMEMLMFFIDAIPGLTDLAKEHFKRQFGILLDASAYRRLMEADDDDDDDDDDGSNGGAASMMMLALVPFSDMFGLMSLL